jgi:hypothetical protein
VKQQTAYQYYRQSICETFLLSIIDSSEKAVLQQAKTGRATCGWRINRFQCQNR